MTYFIGTNHTIMTAVSSEVDKRGCWVMVVACFWTYFCSVSFARSQPVIFVALLDHFQITREDAAWPIGLYGLFNGLSAVISGYLTIYFSIRSILITSALVAGVAVSLCSQATNLWHINVLYGFFQGIGMGPIACLVPGILVRYFFVHRTSAMGISTAGVAVGSIIWPGVTHWLLEEFGLHGTFLLLGGIILNSLVGIAFLKDPDDESATAKAQTVDAHENTQISSKGEASSNNVKQENRDLSLTGQNATDTERRHMRKPQGEMSRFRKVVHHTIQILTNIDACAALIVCAVTFFIFRAYQLSIVDFAEERSVPVERGTNLVSIHGACDLFGKLTFGWVTDRKWITRKSIFYFILFFHGIGVLALTICYNYESLIGVFALAGFMFGGFMTTYVPLFAETVDSHLVPLITGMFYFLNGLQTFLLPLFVGCFKDRYQSYPLMYICLGVMQFASTGLWLLVAPIRKLIAPHKEDAVHSTNNECKDTVPGHPEHDGSLQLENHL